jgi:hypothetical protein
MIEMQNENAVAAGEQCERGSIKYGKRNESAESLNYAPASELCQATISNYRIINQSGTPT